MAIQYRDYGNVLRTPIRAICFNNFFLPETFKLESIGEPRRLSSSIIQRRHGILQQTTYSGPIAIEIKGQVYTNQFEVSPGTPLDCDEIIDVIKDALKTNEDKRLHIRDGRFYYARLSNIRTSYIANTNQNVAELQLSFIASDPHQYAITPTDIGDLIAQGNDRITHEEPIINNSTTDTPIKITLTISRTTVPTIEIHMFPNTETKPADTDNPTTKLILESPGVQSLNQNGYYQQDDKIIIDSKKLELTYQPVTEDATNDRIRGPAFHHIKGENNTQNLPINLQNGSTFIGIKATDAVSQSGNSITASFEFRERWA